MTQLLNASRPNSRFGVFRRKHYGVSALERGLLVDSLHEELILAKAFPQGALSLHSYSLRRSSLLDHRVRLRKSGGCD
jgi:hypothetical protein